DLTKREELSRSVDLRAYEAGLVNNEKVRVIANANDILLNPEDVAWMKSTYKDRLMLFERGGHLGNLSETIVQREIVRALADLLPAHARY
ncbi:MAG: MlaA family lipoprotein, partial [Limisphaerales bacterium]